MSKTDRRERSDGGEDAPEDTRWIKYGFRADGEFRDVYSGGVVDHETADVVPRFEIHQVLREGQVEISLTVTPSGNERTPEVGAMGSFTVEQILELADALEEVAGAAKDGEVR
jgi:hypothetical protein